MKPQGQNVVSMSWIAQQIDAITGESDPKLKLIYQSAPLAGVGDTLRNNVVENGYLYQNSRAAPGLRIWNVYDPSAPVLLSTLGVYGIDLRKSGRYVYSTDVANRIRVIDVSNPSAPFILSTLTDAVRLDTGHGTFLVDDLLFVAAYGGYEVIGDDDYFTIIDVSDPTNPTILSAITDPLLDGIHDIHVDGRYAYASTHYGGGAVDRGSLVVIDVSNPAAPAIVGSALATPGNSYAHLTKRGPYVFTGVHAGGEGNLTVYDVSDPTAPVEISQITTHGPYWMSWYGKYLVMAGAEYLNLFNVTIWDASDPLNLRLVDSWSIPGATDSRNVFVDGKYAYVTYMDSTNGYLLVFEIEQVQTPSQYELYQSSRDYAEKLFLR